MQSQFEMAAAVRRFAWWVLGVIIAASPADATEPPTLESIRGRIQEQWSQVRNLHVRLRQETTIHGEPKALSPWRSQPSCPRYCGTEDVLFAFDGEKRYQRVLGLDCQSLDLLASGASADGRPSQPHDVAHVWDKTTLRERTKDRHGRFQHRVVARSEATDCFPPPQYLMNVGFALPGPTATQETRDGFADQWMLPRALEHSSYSLAEEREQVEGSWCLVVQRGNRGAADGAEPGYDKLWFHAAHALTLRRRELRIDNRLVRIVNNDFTEVLAGLWLPRQSRIEYFAPSHVSEQDWEGPVLTQTTKLACCVINQVPSDLFDVALTKSPPPLDSLFGSVGAYHWLRQSHGDGTVNEVWAAEGRGRRMEVRRDSQLLLLSIDTTRWSLIWRPALNRATLLPSRLAGHLREDASSIARRRSRLCSAETLTALFQIQEGQLDGRKVDKLTAYYPADPIEAGKRPIHEFDPRLQSKASGTEYRTRENWFDPDNNLSVHRRCGCENPVWERTVDFPPPESIESSHFSFKLPPGAQLSAANEALRRLFLSTAARDSD